MSDPNRHPISNGTHIVGYVRGMFFRKNLDSTKHFLKSPPGIALEASTIEEVKKFKAQAVVILDENKKGYVACFEAFDRWGYKFNRGHGDQVALPLKHFRSCYLEALAHVEEKDEPKQEPQKQMELV